MGLERFVEAQDEGGVYDRALDELRAGRKQSHWMWFVFPQLRGLGSSPMAQRFAIADLAEARAFAAHPVLGARLRECCDAVEADGSSDAVAIFGSIDALKFRSSLTLFLRAAPDDLRFARLLDRFYGGEPDARTDELLASDG
ncbi:MAG: DUF1810 domain-containing protein [Solirubrobacteraceae bacterium]|nr:DUF1810 domain-containing protein [Solirubrobacteraceae bacterium]